MPNFFIIMVTVTSIIVLGHFIIPANAFTSSRNLAQPHHRTNDRLQYWFPVDDNFNPSFRDLKEAVEEHDDDHDDHENWGAPADEEGYFEQVFTINGKNYTLGQIEGMLNQTRPTYPGAMSCATKDLGHCCPAYCCDVESTIHHLNGSLDIPDLKKQTAKLSVGRFSIFSKMDEYQKHGRFSALICRDFNETVLGGWTLEVTFSKPVLDLHIFNARIVGITNGLSTYYFAPTWNYDLFPGHHHVLVQGQTTPPDEDHLPLNVTGALHYDPTKTRPHGGGFNMTRNIEMRPAVAPKTVTGERFNLAEVLQLSILFYEAQRSGDLPATNRIKWRTSSATKDRSDDGDDLTGGWYDAGDHIKFQVPMAFSTTMLLWGLIRYPEAYSSSRELDNMYDCVKWPLDYFIKTHTKQKELYVQISDDVDHCYWKAAPDETYWRKAYKVTCNNPGSQPVMDTAAAMAAGSIAFKDKDKDYADSLLEHARELWDFAEECPGDYVNDGHIPARGLYDDNGNFHDEHAWGSMWLYYATGEDKYINRARELFDQCCSWVGDTNGYLSWANKGIGVTLLLKQLTNSGQYDNVINGHLDGWMNKASKTPKGLSYIEGLEWGSLRYAANTAWVALVAADLGLKPDDYRRYGMSQIHYILGDCCRDPDTGKVNQTMVIGYGPTWQYSYHHRWSTCNGKDCPCSAGPNYHTLWGAVIGGPNVTDDTISEGGCPDYALNEVATDYNAGFTSAVAAMKQLSLDGKLKDLLVPQ